MSEQRQCPTCKGTGQVDANPRRGKSPHNLTWGPDRGPFGWLMARCAKCTCERTRRKHDTMYRLPGEEHWQPGFKGCPHPPATKETTPHE